MSRFDFGSVVGVDAPIGTIPLFVNGAWGANEQFVDGEAVTNGTLFSPVNYY